MVLTDGSTYWTLWNSPGTLLTSTGLQTSGNTYAVSFCYLQILISIPLVSSTTSVVYNGNTYSTLSGVAVDSSTDNACQSGYIAIPSGWSLAPNNAASIAVIAAHQWSTCAMVTADGTTYWTANNGPTPGSLLRIGGYVQSGNTYAVSQCYLEILIIKGVIVSCGAGYYTNGGSCVLCPSGQYQPSSGQASCILCSAGYYSTGGLTSCTACTAGQYQSSAGAVGCSPISAGTLTHCII